MNADPPRLDEAAKILYREQYRPHEELSDVLLNAMFDSVEHDGDCTNVAHTCYRCEADTARRTTRAVVAFVSRQPREITEAMVAAAAHALSPWFPKGTPMNQLAAACAALETAEKARNKEQPI